MTWQWVTLVLGIVFLFCLLLAYVTWTQMKLKMFEARPHTIPDLFTTQKSSVLQQPEESKAGDQDTLVQAKWPEGFTGGEDASA